MIFAKTTTCRFRSTLDFIRSPIFFFFDWVDLNVFCCNLGFKFSRDHVIGIYIHKFTKAQFKRRTFHEPNQMQISVK